MNLETALILAYIICAICFNIAGWLLIIFGTPKVLMSRLKNGFYDEHMKELMTRYILPAGKEFMKDELLSFGEHMKKSIWGKQGNINSQKRKAEKAFAKGIYDDQSPMIGSFVNDMPIPFIDHPTVAKLLAPHLAKIEEGIVEKLLSTGLLPQDAIVPIDGQG